MQVLLGKVERTVKTGQNIDRYIGKVFAVHTSTEPQVTGLIAELLDADNGSYDRIVVQDDVVAGVFRPITASLATASYRSYKHAILMKNADGSVWFSDMPYRADNYPEADHKVDLYTHPDGKLWAIAVQENKVWYKNDQTDGRLVFQLVDGTKSPVARINEKLSKGYSYVGPRTYDAKTRNIN